MGNKAFDPSEHPRATDGTFKDTNKRLPGTLPAKNQTDTRSLDELSYDELLPAVDAFDDPYEARHVEFTTPDGSTIDGYALDYGRIDQSKVPDGWHAYSVSEWDTDEPSPYLEDSNLTTLSIDTDGNVNHRMDFITRQDLTSQINNGELGEIKEDDWGFRDTSLVDDLADKSGEDDYDLDIALEWKRRQLLDTAARDQIFFKPNEENMLALRAAVDQTVAHDENKWGESEISDLHIVKSTDLAGLHLDTMTPDQIREAREYGGWNPDKHPYMRFNQDGDLEGLTQKQADKLIWQNRQRIIQAVREDDNASMNTVNLLHNAFDRQRQLKEQSANV